MYSPVPRLKTIVQVGSSGYDGSMTQIYSFLYDLYLWIRYAIRRMAIPAFVFTRPLAVADDQQPTQALPAEASALKPTPTLTN